jgi:catechol 2,3-dioxygenase-like lactoylglutathione lyase family enzyme
MQQNNGNDALLKSWPAGIYAITLFQEDPVAAKKFYQEVFGLTIVYEDANS